MRNEIVSKWIMKAENDIKTAKDELSTETPATDTVCFNAQQYVEKYLKAFLILHGREIRKTHDIAELIEACTEIESNFRKLYEYNADHLTVYAIDARYPDQFYIPTIEEANNSLEIALKTKEFIIEEEKELGIIDI